MLNISFNFSRKLRDEVEEKFNWQAGLMLMLSAGNIALNVYMLLKIWAVGGNPENSFLQILAGLCLALEVGLLAYTIGLAAVDCNIVNATCLSTYLTFCLYRYTMRSIDPECRVENFTVGNLIFVGFQSRLI